MVRIHDRLQIHLHPTPIPLHLLLLHLVVPNLGVVEIHENVVLDH